MTVADLSSVSCLKNEAGVGDFQQVAEYETVSALLLLEQRRAQPFPAVGPLRRCIFIRALKETRFSRAESHQIGEGVPRCATRPQIRRDFTSGLAQGRCVSPPRHRSPGWTHLAGRGQTRQVPEAPQPSGVHVGGGCRRPWTPQRSYLKNAWQHKSHGLRRRARFLTCMAALEDPLSRLAHWVWNHQLAEAKEETHWSNFTTLNIPLVPNVNKISLSNNNCHGGSVAYKSRYRGDSAHILAAVTLH